jgi:hypothetical protein
MPSGPFCHSRVWLAREKSPILPAHSALKISPLKIGRLNQRDFGAARHLLDFALATNGLADIMEFFGIDQRGHVIASRA